jgi:hypothetical protein
MIELYGGENQAIVGIRYEADEPAAVAFALGLYANQLDAGRIVDEPDNHPGAREVVRLCQELSGEIDSGLTTLTPEKHQAVAEICLPYLVRMHERLPTDTYADVCELLEVRPFELFMNAIEARRMLNNANVHIQIMADQAEAL